MKVFLFFIMSLVVAIGGSVWILDHAAASEVGVYELGLVAIIVLVGFTLLDRPKSPGLLGAGRKKRK